MITGGKMKEKRGFQGTSWVGLILIILGALWILNNLDILDFRLSEWWPLILIVIGLIHLVSGGRLFNAGAWILIFLGAVFLLTTNEYLEWDQIWRFWPIALILIGLSILTQHHGKPVPKSDADDISGSTIFGSINKKINSKQFKGGNLSALFGGVEIDLKDSTLDESGAIINVSTTFGGTELKIPNDWPLDIRSTTIFGGVENKTDNPVSREGKRLTIKASTIFGGIEIKN
jgi:predicted membrane protein